MAKRKARMATLWEVPDGLWERIEPLMRAMDPPKRASEKPDQVGADADWRANRRSMRWIIAA
jgi:hypothetical protein